MPPILRMKKLLRKCPQPLRIKEVAVRSFRGGDDVLAWLSLRRLAFSGVSPGGPGWTKADFDREFLAKPWWRPDRMWFAVPVEGDIEQTPVGTVTLAQWSGGERSGRERPKPVVHWLAVAPSWRRRGIGRLLMASLEAACWNDGHRELSLQTHESWSDATAFYRELGYVHVNASP